MARRDGGHRSRREASLILTGNRHRAGPGDVGRRSGEEEGLPAVGKGEPSSGGVLVSDASHGPERVLGVGHAGVGPEKYDDAANRASDCVLEHWEPLSGWCRD